jgi:hypothetical protein
MYANSKYNKTIKNNLILKNSSKEMGLFCSKKRLMYSKASGLKHWPIIHPYSK